ncbi:hypothetical protein GGF32_009765 [Allomyces javanicus]|nr:hypothetical protein GGF32_009765 [Allomyces javanicus]
MAGRSASPAATRSSTRGTPRPSEPPASPLSSPSLPPVTPMRRTASTARLDVEGTPASDASSTKRRRGRAPKSSVAAAGTSTPTPSKAAGASSSILSRSGADRNPPIEEEEAGEDEIDPKGEEKINKDGELTGTRRFKIPSFLIPERHPTRQYMFAPDVAKCVGQRDGFTLFMRNPQLTRLWTTEKQREYLASVGLLSPHLKSRNITLLPARTVFRHFGHAVVRKGKPVRDDYWVGDKEYNSADDSSSESDTPASESTPLPATTAAGAASVSAAAFPGAPALSATNATKLAAAMALPRTDLLAATTNPSKYLQALNDYARMQNLPPVSSRGTASVEHMYHAALSTREYNARLAAFRKSARGAFVDAHTGLSLAPESRQPTRAGLQVKSATDHKIEPSVAFPQIPVGSNVEPGWTDLPPGGAMAATHPIALVPGQAQARLAIHPDRFVAAPGVEPHGVVTGAPSATDFGTDSMPYSAVTTVLHATAPPTTLPPTAGGLLGAPPGGPPLLTAYEDMPFAVLAAALASKGAQATAPKPVMYCSGVSYTGDPCRRLVNYAGEFCNYHRNQQAANAPPKPVVLCSGVSSSGDPCRRIVNDQGEFCSYHRNQDANPARVASPDPDTCPFCKDAVDLAPSVEDTPVDSISPTGLACASCARRFHAQCADITTPTTLARVTTYDWHCSTCKNCVVCARTGVEDQLLFCDHCERGWHTYCLVPNLAAPPHGKWLCPLCAYCNGCGAQGFPEGSSRPESVMEKAANAGDGEDADVEDAMEVDDDDENAALKKTTTPKDPAAAPVPAAAVPLTHVVENDVYIGTFCRACRAHLDSRAYCPMCLRTEPDAADCAECTQCKRHVHRTCDPVEGDEPYTCPCCRTDPDLTLLPQHVRHGAMWAVLNGSRVLVPGHVRCGAFAFDPDRGVVKRDDDGGEVVVPYPPRAMTASVAVVDEEEEPVAEVETPRRGPGRPRRGRPAAAVPAVEASDEGGDSSSLSDPDEPARTVDVEEEGDADGDAEDDEMVDVEESGEDEASDA